MSRATSTKARLAAPPAPVDDFSSGTESDDSDAAMDFARPGGTAGGDDDDDDDEEDGEDDGLINVEFSFVDPIPIDFKSVRRLLESYLPGVKTFNASALAEVITAQVQLGTMVKVKDDLDVYAMATIVPLAVHRDTDWAKDIRAYLLAHCKDSKKRAALSALFDGGRVGLLLNERVVNVPPELCPALHGALCADIEWAKVGPQSTLCPRPPLLSHQYSVCHCCSRTQRPSTSTP